MYILFDQGTMMIELFVFCFDWSLRYFRPVRVALGCNALVFFQGVKSVFRGYLGYNTIDTADVPTIAPGRASIRCSPSLLLVLVLLAQQSWSRLLLAACNLLPCGLACRS